MLVRRGCKSEGFWNETLLFVNLLILMNFHVDVFAVFSSFGACFHCFICEEFPLPAAPLVSPWMWYYKISNNDNRHQHQQHSTISTPLCLASLPQPWQASPLLSLYSHIVFQVVDVASTAQKGFGWQQFATWFRWDFSLWRDYGNEDGTFAFLNPAALKTMLFHMLLFDV